MSESTPKTTPDQDELAPESVAQTPSKIDIPPKHFIDNLPNGMRPYLRLMRLDRPIGTWLLLFPCWWTYVLASQAKPEISVLILFAVGAVVMRGAGCVMNDIADRNYDGKVERTRTRPIPAGEVSVKQAALFMGCLCLLGLGILLQFNQFAILLGAGSLALVAIYPFCKPFTYWPQAVLGLTFNWGALMGWAVYEGELALPAFLFYAAGLFWTLGYDTIYAHQDKDDDEMIGIKSTALKLGEKTVPALWIFYGLTIALMGLAGHFAEVGILYYLALGIAASQLVWQIKSLDINDANNCLMLFKSNKLFGWLVLFACMMSAISF